MLLLDPPGVGKTHLAVALGVKAVTNGFSVASMTADEMLDQVRRDDAAGLRRTQRRRDTTAAVLVIDELGFQALDRRDAYLLFKVLSSRLKRASMIITSNTSIREWPGMIAGDEMLATVILDRLLHHCHVVQIDGRSFRLREVQTRGSEGSRRSGTSAQRSPLEATPKSVARRPAYRCRRWAWCAAFGGHFAARGWAVAALAGLAVLRRRERLLVT